jgi:Protein of unknown function (DUF1153)
MYESPRSKVESVMGPYGPVTAVDLPSAETKRWSIRRKATVTAAVKGGLLSLEEACSRYALDVEELLSWQYCIDHYGLQGLRTTRAQFYSTNVARAPRMRSVAELQRTNSRAVRAVAVLFGELIRACQQEIIHLAGPEHGLAFNRRLIEIVQESNVLTILPDDQMEGVRAAVMGVVENMIRLRRPGIVQAMTLEGAARHAEKYRRKGG